MGLFYRNFFLKLGLVGAFYFLGACFLSLWATCWLTRA